MLSEKYSTSISNERNSRMDKSHKPLPKGAERARLSYANTIHELLEHTNSTAHINTIHYFALRHEQKMRLQVQAPVQPQRFLEYHNGLWKDL